MKMEAKLVEGGAPQPIARKLIAYVAEADDMSLNNIKPYALADYWHLPRRDMLETALIATRAGLLDMSWDLLCPSCRNRKEGVKSLSEISKTVHCDACQIDYTANFEYSVELTFKPNPLIRELDATEFCVGGPGLAPHVLVQQLLKPDEQRRVPGPPDVGSYRLRTMAQNGGIMFRVEGHGGLAEIVAEASELDIWSQGEAMLHHDNGIITLSNHTPNEQLFMLEHLVWADQAVTAADVTTKQMFRDLFSSEALRPDDQISVGSLTIVFTDLLGSTALYHEIGDAPAFGRVMEHFDVLRENIRQEDGTIVKTIGDAVMAVFRQPDKAVRAMTKAQLAMDEVGIGLRVGIHTGRCIAVTLNDRLDYFGTSVNMAARLEGFSNGYDVVISEDVYNDPAVSNYVQANTNIIPSEFTAQLKGFPEQRYTLWRLSDKDLLETVNEAQTAPQRS
jgi:class 3 adenylate cyclase